MRVGEVDYLTLFVLEHVLDLIIISDFVDLDLGNHHWRCRFALEASAVCADNFSDG